MIIHFLVLISISSSIYHFLLLLCIYIILCDSTENWVSVTTLPLIYTDDVGASDELLRSSPLIANKTSA